MNMPDMDIDTNQLPSLRYTQCPLVNIGKAKGSGTGGMECIGYACPAAFLWPSLAMRLMRSNVIVCSACGVQTAYRSVICTCDQANHLTYSLGWATVYRVISYIFDLESKTPDHYVGGIGCWQQEQCSHRTAKLKKTKAFSIFNASYLIFNVLSLDCLSVRLCQSQSRLLWLMPLI